MGKSLQLFFLCLALAGPSNIQAKTKVIVVDTAVDSAIHNCTLLNKCRLRSAIEIAASGDRITFSPDLDGAFISLLSGELTIDKNIVIDGDLDNDGSADIAVSGYNYSRVFSINDSLVVTLDGLIITNGYLSTGALGGGAGISIGNGGSTTIKNSRITNNETLLLAGGGIQLSAGSLSIVNCTFNNNSATHGGAIENRGSVYISGSTFIDNEAEGEGGAIYSHPNGRIFISRSYFHKNNAIQYATSFAPSYSGGAITSLGELTITESIFGLNEVRNMSGPTYYHIGSGGAIYNNGGIATINQSILIYNMAGDGGAIRSNANLRIFNSTFSWNRANNHGGGIYTYTATPGPGVERILEIRNCTISNNLAGYSGTGGRGGGIYLSYATGLSGEHISNSIVTASIGGGDCYIVPGHGDLETNVSNIIEDGSCSAPLSGDPLLAELADNGGPTRTHALLPGSPAINAGSAAEVLSFMTTDQRGNGFSRIIDGRVDIGAYEFKNTHFFVIPHSNGKAVIFGL